MSNDSLYERLGGYEAISAVVNDLLPRLQADSELGRFWQPVRPAELAAVTVTLFAFFCFK